MDMVIVPNVLSDAINSKLDAAFEKVPAAAKDRDVLYHKLLEYYDQHGEIPDFDLVPTERRGTDHGQG